MVIIIQLVIFHETWNQNGYVKISISKQIYNIKSNTNYIIRENPEIEQE